MKLLRLHALPEGFSLPPTAVTIGNFDGVHVGHQAMIAALQQTAQQQQLKTLVMLFEPQPLEFFKGLDAPPRITAWREKIELLRDLGVDYIVSVRFDQAFRSLTAQAFADLLKQRLNAQSLIIGDDFRFGCDRAGDREFLMQYGFPVASLPTIEIDGGRVSSTRIRQCLQDGDFVQAAHLLGRPYTITGRVQYGDQIGRTIDFPTANVALNRLKPCLHGIYAVEMQTLGGATLPERVNGGVLGYAPDRLYGAGHLGTRPALEGIVPLTWRLEVFLPQASANLYGLRVKVRFLHFLHGEIKYPSFDALKDGIQDDVKKLLAWREDNADAGV